MEGDSEFRMGTSFQSATATSSCTVESLFNEEAYSQSWTTLNEFDRQDRGLLDDRTINKQDTVDITWIRVLTLHINYLYLWGYEGHFWLDYFVIER